MPVCSCLDVLPLRLLPPGGQLHGFEKYRLIPPLSLLLPSVPPGASGNIPSRNTLEGFPTLSSIALTSTHMLGVHWEPDEVTQTISRLDV